METLFEEIQQHSGTALKKFILSFLDQFELISVNRDWQAINLCKEPANGLRLSLRVAIIVIPLHKDLKDHIVVGRRISEEIELKVRVAI